MGRTRSVPVKPASPARRSTAGGGTLTIERVRNRRQARFLKLRRVVGGEWRSHTPGEISPNQHEPSAVRISIIGTRADLQPKRISTVCTYARTDPRLLAPLPAEADPRMSHLRRGWYWGSQRFVDSLKALVESNGRSQRSRGYRGAAARRSHGMNRAQAWLEEGLRRAKLPPESLARLPGSDWRKVAIARLIAAHTIASHQWLAENLAMRSAANVSQLLRTKGEQEEGKHLPTALRRWIQKERATARHTI